MAVNTKEIKGRIKTVKNTAKITKAMEMVAAAKMRKAIEATLGTRMYATLSRELFERLGHLDEPNMKLLQQKPVEKILVILVTSNRGLCGSFNSNVMKQTKKALEDVKTLATHKIKDGQDVVPTSDVTIDVIGIGKKSAAFAKRNGYELIGVYDSLSEAPGFEDVVPIAGSVIDGFQAGTYQKIFVSYTDFKSTMTQVPVMRQILPMTSEAMEVMSNVSESLDQRDPSPDLGRAQDDSADVPMRNYLFEPSLDEIVEYVIPRLVEIQLFQAVLESAASEHSSRMIAMKNASEAAGDMIKALNLEFNKGRQAAITQEIAEIASGAAALG